MENWNYIIFIIILLIYYWHSINTLIEEFYKKKKDEIHLTENQIEYFKNNEPLEILKSNGIYASLEHNLEDDNKNLLKNFIKCNLHKEKRIITGEETLIQEGLSDEGSEEIITNKNEENKNNDLSDIFAKEEDIFNKNNIRKETEKNNNEIANNVQEDIKPIKKIFKGIFNICYTFIISIFPALCDEFELNNPFPDNRNNSNQNQPVEENHGDDQNDQEMNQNNIEEEKKKNDNLNPNLEMKEIKNEENSITKKKKNEDDLLIDEKSKQNSSKVVNTSDDLNRVFKLIKNDENVLEKISENEYVFSEKGMIDNISNEGGEFLFGKEKEKEKGGEKEKEIFTIPEENK